jgi:lysophospholipase L1-like esterase
MPLWLMFVFPLAAYFIWELYWYNQLGLNFIKWHTHLMLYVYLWLIMAVLIHLLFRKNNNLSNNFILAGTSVIFMLFGAELFLEITELKKTYLEKIGNGYTSPYIANTTHGHYHGWPSIEKEHWIVKREYKYWRPTNTHGVGDYEWKVEKDSSELRILTLGDSFTEGDGAPYDSSYPAILKNLFHSYTIPINIMNAGVCGSDPFYNYLHLKNELVAYQPDVVIQTIASHDLITDIILRGGMERFKSDGGQQFRNAPWWEAIYAVSYLSRFYFSCKGYTELLRKKYLTNEEVAWLNKTLIKLLDDYIKLCAENNIKLIMVLRPDREEIIMGKYAFDFTLIKQKLQETDGVQTIDLLPKYIDYIEAHNSNTTDYFWEFDGHHNSKGYSMMAATIFEEIYLVNDTMYAD